MYLSKLSKEVDHISNPQLDDKRQHPLLQDYWRMLSSSVTFEVSHVFQEANSAADLMASFVVEHLGSILWDSMVDLPVQFLDIL